MKVYEVIEKIKEWHQPYIEQEKTRDIYLCGDPQTECRGVAVTCACTLEVMHKAVEKGINLIISHEGITYNYEKKYQRDEFKNETLLEKLNYAKEHDLVVWRDHDHMHGTFLREENRRLRHDMIFYGTMKELGWEEYLTGDELKPLLFKVPEMSAREFGQQLIKAWNLNGLRIVGDLDGRVSTVYIVEHVIAGKFDDYDLGKIDMAEDIDAFIPLEIVDYTLTSYVRDAAYLGKNKIIYEMGHFNAEELGMKYLARVLPEVLGMDVEFIQSGDTFNYLIRE
ncbi:MAG: Nif3-like dinuclear metal center hexameric protein [Erysipelotrichaceae bacterium]|nr:Nif3-like dinuclear metal center hexameric protein [Erysipelotrichaceae bacterium]